MTPARRHFRIAVALSAALGTVAVHAEPALTFSGYGTLGVIHSDNGRADYVADSTKPNGVGATRDTSFDVDTRFAAQANIKLTPSLFGVVQVVAQQRYDNTYRPMLEWANIRYDVTPDLSLRAGRVVLPIFLVSDTRRVGFANVWARPPVEVYNLVPVSNSDGFDVSYRMNLGPATNTLNAIAGVTKPKFPAQAGGAVTNVEARRLLAVVDTVESGSATLKLSYGRADLTVDSINVLFDGYRQLGPAGAAIADRYDLRDGMCPSWVSAAATIPAHGSRLGSGRSSTRARCWARAVPGTLAPAIALANSRPTPHMRARTRTPRLPIRACP